MALETVTNIADLVAANPTGADPKSDGDDHIRNLKTALLNGFAGFTGSVIVTGTDGGAVNAYTLTPARAVPAYTSRMLAVFAPVIANTGACTINVSGLGVKSLVSVSGAALVSGDLTVGSVYAAVYDGAQFRLTSITKNYADQLAFSTALPLQTDNAGKYITTNGTVASWVTVVPPQILRLARTANVILGVADKQSLVDITSGTFSQTFDAAATLGNGWYCWIRNSGTGDITLDPNAAETIDGLATFIMYPGEARLIQCDGTALRSVVVTPFIKTFTANGTFTKPPGYSVFTTKLWSGGASGGRSGSLTGAASGGGGGGCGEFSIPSASVAATESISVGAGGNGITATGNGAVGGNSSFGTLATVFAATNYLDGGSPLGLVSAIPLGYDGMQSAATPSATRPIWGGGASSSAGTAVSGSSRNGGGAGGSVDIASNLFAAGTSLLGGNGGAAGAGASGVAGAVPAGGGGATQTGATSGAGGRGEVRIWGVA